MAEAKGKIIAVRKRVAKDRTTNTKNVDDKVDAPNGEAKTTSKSRDVNKQRSGATTQSEGSDDSDIDKRQRRQQRPAAEVKEEAQAAVDHTRFSVPLIDEAFTWRAENAKLFTAGVEAGVPLVVGIVGAQGTGKSTLLSMLARNKPDDMFREYVFRPNAKEGVELGRHQTNGVNIYVDNRHNRIFLDTQPLSSPSQVEDAVRVDRRFEHDYTSMENSIDLESLQVLTFMMTVCNVLIVTDDTFMTLSLANMLTLASDARPTVRIKSSGRDVAVSSLLIVFVNSASAQVCSDSACVLCFVQQRCRRARDFAPDVIRRRGRLLKKLLRPAHVNFTCGVSYLFLAEREEEQQRILRSSVTGSVKAPKHRVSDKDRLEALAQVIRDNTQQSDVASDSEEGDEKDEVLTKIEQTEKEALALSPKALARRSRDRRINYFPLSEIRLRSRDDPPPREDTGAAAMASIASQQQRRQFRAIVRSSQQPLEELIKAGQSRKMTQEEKPPEYEASTEARLLNECLATDDRIREYSTRMSRLTSNDHFDDTVSDQLSAQMQQALLEPMPPSSSSDHDLCTIDTPPLPSFHDESSQMASMPGRQPMQQQARRRQQVSDNVPPYADAVKQLRTLILSLPPGEIVPGVQLTRASWLQYAERVWQQCRYPVPRTRGGARTLFDMHKKMP